MNRKYVGKKAKESSPVVAEATEKEEDLKKEWGCTLFEVEFQNGSTDTIRIRNKGFGDVVWVNEQDAGSYLFGGDRPLSYDPQDKAVTFKIIDWDTLYFLPSQVAFKGDNGKYIYASVIEHNRYHDFWSDDSNAEGSQYEVFPNPDGTVRIKSKRFGKFWVRGWSNWIMADSTDSEEDKKNLDTLFWPVKRGDNKVSLRNMGNDHYVARLWADGKTNDCLNARIAPDESSAATCIFEVVELVRSRQIINVHFHQSRARIYGQRPITMHTLESPNKGSIKTTDTLHFESQKTTSKTWNSSSSWKLGVETSFKSGVPNIVEGEIKISAEMEESRSWGKANEETTKFGYDREVIVPPKTKLIARLIADEGCCDVPFSYTIRDTLLDGTVTYRDMDDGLFTGVNTYNVRIVTEDVPIK